MTKYKEFEGWECPKCNAPNRQGNGRCWSCGTKEPVQAVQELDAEKEQETPPYYHPVHLDGK